MSENKHLGSSFSEHAAQSAEETARQLEKAIEVVRFYADRENWDDDKFAPTVWDDGNPDVGEKARAFLEELGEC